MEYPKFEDLKGKTLTKVERVEDEELIFHTTEGEIYNLYHSQDCCESVTIEDICGDLDDLIGSPLLVAEEVEYAGEQELPNEERVRLQLERSAGDGYYEDSQTWTFYKLDTIKGGVTIRWYGESNGYYSESVDFEQVA